MRDDTLAGQCFLVTGGTGYIGSTVIRYLIHLTLHRVINVSKLTLAWNLESLAEVVDSERYHFTQVDICDAKAIETLFTECTPDVVMHLAAESHVDRSISDPADSIQTNATSTYMMLEATHNYCSNLDGDEQADFRIHHISTDEVCGSLNDTGLSTEQTAYDPSSPYSASLASSDHLIHAWYHTYGLPVLVANYSDNSEPFQFPEKPIPLVILNALKNKPLPINGNGMQARDLLLVEDHARALYEVVTKGKVGETYKIGVHIENTNLDMIKPICAILDEMRPTHTVNISLDEELNSYGQDRPYHDQRCAIDASKSQTEPRRSPRDIFEAGIHKAGILNLENTEWIELVSSSGYSNWMEANYGKREAI